MLYMYQGSGTNVRRNLCHVTLYLFGPSKKEVPETIAIGLGAKCPASNGKQQRYISSVRKL